MGAAGAAFGSTTGAAAARLMACVVTRSGAAAGATSEGSLKPAMFGDGFGDPNLPPDAAN